MTPIPERRTARPVWRHPVVQFVAVGVLLAVAVAALASWFTERAAREEALQDARFTTELLARTVVQPALRQHDVADDIGELDRFDRRMTSRLRDSRVVRVKLWNDEGEVVYSDEVRLIGQQFPLGDDQLAVLARGGTNVDVSDLARSENEFDRDLGQVLEVYTRVTGQDGEPMLFELYLPYDDLTERTDEVLAAFRPIGVGGVLLFLLLTVPLVWLLARQVDASAQERERLLLAAADASDAERRRIARDLHDGVVQDLAGTSLSLSATARALAGGSELDRPGLEGALTTLASGVRRSLRSLRSLLVEIYPPDLSGSSLPAALDDLLAPVAAGGVEVTVDAAPGADLSDDTAALVWRTAQECVRNAVRHADPQHLRVTVRRSLASTGQDRVVLTVADDGRGFDPALPLEGSRFGLRGLRDLAAESGGSLSVESSPYAGTTVTLEVPVR